MADRLQLKNRALRLCLAVGLPASKDHTNTGFDLSWLGGGVRRAMQSAAHCTFGENARRTQPRQALHQAAEKLPFFAFGRDQGASEASEKLSFLPLGGSRGLQPPEVGQSIQGALAPGLLPEAAIKPFSAACHAVRNGTGCPPGIRTPIDRFRADCPTIERGGSGDRGAHPARVGEWLRRLPFRVYWPGCARSTPRGARVTCPLQLSRPVQPPLRCAHPVHLPAPRGPVPGPTPGPPWR